MDTDPPFPDTQSQMVIDVVAVSPWFVAAHLRPDLLPFNAAVFCFTILLLGLVLIMQWTPPHLHDQIALHV
ncbi:hypothetical protein B0H14DRAFT_3432829 [Mycena olivaceomarginata]|nr:hypothetical protein B0H14DRAFT_3432829 [Mycena olivaceomarginata]